MLPSFVMVKPLFSFTLSAVVCVVVFDNWLTEIEIRECYLVDYQPLTFSYSCKSLINYRTFMKDFLKVVDFLHYLKAEGYDMVTFEKVRDDTK